MIKDFSLLCDQAMCEGDETRSDGLGFGTYAKVLANAASNVSGPFTIGVFGEWGTGKTSLMRIMQKQLDQNENVLTVWFNAWRYENEEHPIVPLVGSIVRELETHRSFTGKLTNAGTTLVRALRAIAYGFSSKAKVKLPGFAEIEASFVAKDMIERDEKLTPDPLLDRSLYYQAFEALAAVKFPASTRIVVIIDDLDRCFPDQAIRLLESIKLVLNQTGFVFVLGVARQVIEGYLQHRYSEEFGIKDFQGHAYLDKIVQLPFHIPDHVGRMDLFTGKLLDQLRPETARQLTEILPIAGEAMGGNPRSVIRFVNNILIDLAINADLSDLGEMENIPVEYFAISRCLQQKWPNIYTLLSQSDDLATSVAGWSKYSLRELISSDDRSVQSVAAAMASDNGLRALLNTNHGHSWLTNSATRSETVSFLRAQRRETSLTSAVESTKIDIFLSYAHSDAPAVFDLAQMLTDENVKVFMDSQLAPGTDWARELTRKLSEARAVGVCIGPKTKKSNGVGKEIDAAISRSSRSSDFMVIPILLPGSDYTNLPISLSHIQALDLRNGVSKAGVSQLVNVLRNL